MIPYTTKSFNLKVWKERSLNLNLKVWEPCIHDFVKTITILYNAVFFFISANTLMFFKENVNRVTFKVHSPT